MIPELEGPQRGVAAARHQTPALRSVLLRAHGQVMQTNSGPIQLLSAPCLGEQKGCVSLQGTRGDVGKAHPQGHFFWEGFPASIQYFESREFEDTPVASTVSGISSAFS